MFAQSASARMYRPSLAANLITFVCRVFQVRSERRALANLDDRLLADAGIDREAQRIEISRSALDLPRRWL